MFIFDTLGNIIWFFIKCFLILCGICVGGAILISILSSVYDSAKKSYNSTGSSTPLSETDESVIQEVVQYIETISRLYNGQSPLDYDNLGSIMLIPVNERKQMYYPDSCRIRVSLLLFEDDEWRKQYILRKAEQNNSSFGTYFFIEKENDSTFYVTYTAGRFSKNYKKFMSRLFYEINSLYPNKFSFDGSRVMSNGTYAQYAFK